MHNSQSNPLVSEYPSGPDASLFKGILFKFKSLQLIHYRTQVQEKVGNWVSQVRALFTSGVKIHNFLYYQSWWAYTCLNFNTHFEFLIGFSIFTRYNLKYKNQ